MRIVIVFGIDALQKNLTYNDYHFNDSFVCPLNFKTLMELQL